MGARDTLRLEEAMPSVELPLARFGIHPDNLYPQFPHTAEAAVPFGLDMDDSVAVAAFYLH